jgi:hypothetical protein
MDQLKDESGGLAQRAERLEADKQALQLELGASRQQAQALQQQLEAAAAAAGGSGEASQRAAVAAAKLRAAEARAEELEGRLGRAEEEGREASALLAAADRELSGLREDHGRLLDLLARYDVEKGQLQRERQALLEQMPQGSGASSGASSGAEGGGVGRAGGAGGSEVAALEVGAAAGAGVVVTGYIDLALPAARPVHQGIASAHRARWLMRTQPSCPLPCRRS